MEFVTADWYIGNFEVIRKVKKLEGGEAIRNSWWLELEWRGFKPWELCKLLWLNPAVQGNYPTTQLLWASTQLLVTNLSPTHLVDQLLLVILRWSAGEMMLWSLRGCVVLWQSKVKNWMSMGILLTSLRGKWFVYTENREV